MPKYIRHSNTVISLQNPKITFYCSLPIKNRHFLKNTISTMLFYFSNDFEKFIKFFYKKADCILRKKSQLLFWRFFEIQKFHEKIWFLELEKFQKSSSKSMIFGWKIDIQNRAPKIRFLDQNRAPNRAPKIIKSHPIFWIFKIRKNVNFYRFFDPFLVLFWWFLGKLS